MPPREFDDTKSYLIRLRSIPPSYQCSVPYYLQKYSLKNVIHANLVKYSSMGLGLHQILPG